MGRLLKKRKEEREKNRERERETSGDGLQPPGGPGIVVQGAQNLCRPLQKPRDQLGLSHCDSNLETFSLSLAL